MFAAVLAGDHIAQGFRNQDIRTALYADTPKDAAATMSAAVGRLLKRLHVRGLVAKVPRTRRWRVTEPGRRVLGDTLHTYRRYHVPSRIMTIRCVRKLLRKCRRTSDLSD